ncbi:hypothetical protein AA313_de0200582 [Arthrobotrys entomopaga]|nr:hypothetical protein AA313_de0200582 [Arthrobotrys entomopaga]
MSWPVYLIVSVGGGRQDHHAIFIETQEGGPKTGHLYQVTGSMQNVMEICEAVPAPKKQFQGPKRLYPREPLRACQEWAAEVVKILRDERVVQL